MVALNTLQEFLKQGTSHAPGTQDEVTSLMTSLVKLPEDARIYTKNSGVRQWIYSQTVSQSQFFTLEILFGSRTQSYALDGKIPKDKLLISVSGGWNSYVDGLETGPQVSVNLEDFRTPKEAVEAVCKKFVDRFQKLSSRGNVKVFYDESKMMWSWKRLNSDSFIRDENDDAYNKKTCMSICKVNGCGIVPDEFVFLNRDDFSRISNGDHSSIVRHANNYYFKSCLVTIYRNEVPFTSQYCFIPQSEVEQYEFVLVDGERRYISLKRSENFLLSFPVHSYNTRIEQLIPANKLFLLGKTDLYSRRDKAEVPFLGWELEACSNKSTVGTSATAKMFKEYMPWLVMCKNDGSISPEGFETVSIPATLDFWQESNLSSTLDSMRVSPYNMRSFEHSKCGFHVHVSRSALSVLDLQKLERFVHNPDNLTFITKVAGRGNGQYQKYIPELFNNRKKWSKDTRPVSTPRSTVHSSNAYLRQEEIQYFCPTIEQVNHNAQSYVDHVGHDEMNKLKQLCEFINNYVDYSSLNNIYGLNNVVLTERYSTVGYDVVDFCYAIINGGTEYFREICSSVPDSNNPEEQIKFMRILFEEVLCPGRPIFSGIVAKFFPDWNLEVTVEELSNTPEIPNWKTGLLKSAAPVGRKNSRAASQIVKGPVGKGLTARYDALNTTNANTVEFRMFKGTMNGTTIMRYLEFVDALVRFVAHTNATNEGLHHQMFIGWLKNDPFNIARYEHLISFLTENGFLERKEIRRKTLPKVVGEDNKTEGLISTVAKGFETGQEAKPLGIFNTPRSDSETEEVSVLSAQEAANNYGSDIPISDGYEEDYDNNGCDCDDCRALRDEL